MKKYKWLNKDSRDFLKRGYLQTGESAEQRGHDIAVAAEKYLKIKGFAEKFENYLSQGFYSLASPIWANFGRERGLPISCNGVFVDDRMDAILEKQAEVGMQTKHGAGTSAYLENYAEGGWKFQQEEHLVDQSISWSFLIKFHLLFLKAM